jgi:hypothetical protein
LTEEFFHEGVTDPEEVGHFPLTPDLPIHRVDNAGA